MFYVVYRKYFDLFFFLFIFDDRLVTSIIDMHIERKRYNYALTH